MEELTDWSGPLGSIAQAAMRKTRPHTLMRDYVARDTRRDSQAVRSLVGTVIASDLAEFKRGKLVPTEQLLSYTRSAEAMQEACWEAMINGDPDLRLPDGTQPTYGDEIDEYPFIGVALEGHPVTLGTWEATDRQLVVYRVLGLVGTGGLVALLPFYLVFGVLLMVVMSGVVAVEALISTFRRRR